MLKIAVVGYNKQQTESAIREIAFSDKDTQPIRAKKDRIRMADGTEYIAICDPIQVNGS